MSTAGFEPSISGSKRPQTYALDRAATGIGTDLHCDYHFPPPMTQQTLLGHGLLTSEVHDHTLRDAPHSVGLFWMNDPPKAETST